MGKERLRFDFERLDVFGVALDAVAILDELAEELPDGRGYTRKSVPILDSGRRRMPRGATSSRWTPTSPLSGNAGLPCRQVPPSPPTPTGTGSIRHEVRSSFPWRPGEGAPTGGAMSDIAWRARSQEGPALVCATDAATTASA